MSTVAFNPQAVLSKLRAKNSLQSSGGNSTISASSSNFPTKYSEPSHNAFVETHESDQKRIEEESQRVRMSLEKETARMQEEIKSLKKENKALKEELDKRTYEFFDLKQRSNKTIDQLRGKLAAISMGVEPASSAKNALEDIDSTFDDNSEIYPHGYPENFGNSESQYFSQFSESSGSQPGFESFRDPTFSELMRRTTHEHHDFVGSLRKPGMFTKYVAVPGPKSSRGVQKKNQSIMQQQQAQKDLMQKQIPQHYNSHNKNDMNTSQQMLSDDKRARLQQSYAIQHQQHEHIAKSNEQKIVPPEQNSANKSYIVNNSSRQSRIPFTDTFDRSSLSQFQIIDDEASLPPSPSKDIFSSRHMRSEDSDDEEAGMPAVEIDLT